MPPVQCTDLEVKLSKLRTGAVLVTKEEKAKVEKVSAGLLQTALNTLLLPLWWPASVHYGSVRQPFGRHTCCCKQGIGHAAAGLSIMHNQVDPHPCHCT
jgi:hypothetical protein